MVMKNYLLPLFLFCSTLAHANSPRYSETPSLEKEINENVDFDVCTVVDFEFVSKNKIDLWNVVCSYSRGKNQSILMFHTPKLNEKYLIFDKSDDVVFVPDYSFEQHKMDDGIHFLKESDFGKFGGALRIFQYKPKPPNSKEYVVVPNKWQSPILRYDNVLILLNNFTLTDKCTSKNCESEVTNVRFEGKSRHNIFGQPI